MISTVMNEEAFSQSIFRYYIIMTSKISKTKFLVRDTEIYNLEQKQFFAPLTNIFCLYPPF